MIIGEKFIFEIGDPVVDQSATDRRVGIVVDIESNEGGKKILVVETDGQPGEIWRLLDENAVLP
ncbi:hypothetical protein [Pseudomonas sp. SED1]|uniref:hypothetical protein n=1 Tax=Pseudomonas sp. SED1 TaxID=3056845 RepID=UPI00296E9DAB|nr:hypothetical protein [Pseudomonas sp. SED1]MDY0834328.1 hypothetical protein [Pseudomonas sp. SED1]